MAVMLSSVSRLERDSESFSGSVIMIGSLAYIDIDIPGLGCYKILTSSQWHCSCCRTIGKWFGQNI